MKRILLLNHNQENFGTYYRCFFLAKGLSELGYKCIMVCASGRKFDILIRRKKISDNFTVITLPRIKYHEYFTGQILLRFPLYMLFALFGNYDICYAFAVAQPQIAIPAWTAKIIRRKKLVIDWDDLWGGGFAEEHSGFVAKVLGFSERYFLRFADKITCISDFLCKKADEQNLGIGITKIPNGANADVIALLDKYESRKKTGLDDDKRYLVSIGNTYTDSLGLMLEAFRDVSKRFDDVRLVMVGEGKVTDKFKGIFDELKDRIVVTGKRPFSEMPLYLASSDVMVLPMDDNPVENARLPFRFGDYLCAKRPIVSNAVGDMRQYMEQYDCGLVSDPGSVDDFAENMIKAMTDKETGVRISANARKFAENEFSWKETVKKLSKEII